MATNDRISCLYFKQNQSSQQSIEAQVCHKSIECLICDQIIETRMESESRAVPLQRHLLTKHKLLIADIESISDLNKYCDHWREKLKHCQDLSHFCAKIQTNSRSQDVSPPEDYHIIGGNDEIFPEDSELRKSLKESNLKSILSQSEIERNDQTFSRNCIFCRKVLTYNRNKLFEHLTAVHNFNVGHPDNIVFCDQLLDILDEKLSKFICLFCEKTFKSWQILKEHMRKKGHKLLNPNNREYDRFYLINYLSPDKHWQQIKLEIDKYEDITGEENEWNDWCEESDEDSRCICLFCQFRSPFDPLKHHLLEIHKFDFETIVLKLEFYSRIKLINYIRRSIHENKCHICLKSFENSDDLIVHLDFSDHVMQTPEQNEYDLPEYFFSTFENDNLLHFLDDNDD